MPHEFCFCLLLNPTLNFFQFLSKILMCQYIHQKMLKKQKISLLHVAHTPSETVLKKSPSGETILPSVNGNFILCSVIKNYTSIYVLHIFSKVGTTLQRLRQLLQVAGSIYCLKPIFLYVLVKFVSRWAQLVHS